MNIYRTLYSATTLHSLHVHTCLLRVCTGLTKPSISWLFKEINESDKTSTYMNQEKRKKTKITTIRRVRDTATELKNTKKRGNLWTNSGQQTDNSDEVDRFLKNIYKLSTANIILVNICRRQCFPSKIRNKAWISTLTISIQHCSWIPSSNERYIGWEGEKKTLLFTDNVIIYVENS